MATATISLEVDADIPERVCQAEAASLWGEN
jgi:hypothetical protein